MYDEGIVMGLAPLGDSSELIEVSGKMMSYLDVFREIIKTKNDFDVVVDTDWVSFHEVRSKFVSDKFLSIFGKKREWDEPITEVHKI